MLPFFVMPKKLPPEVLEFFKKAGRKGGKAGGAKGGHVRAESLTPEQRSEQARKAVTARWAKKKKTQGRKRKPKTAE